jgi:hypothetical protein
LSGKPSFVLQATIDEDKTMNKALILIPIIAVSLLLAKAATAGDLLLIDDNLDVLPPGYDFFEGASSNATSSIQIGPIGASNGLIFDGSWNVPENGQESAVGAMVPVIPTVADFQLVPADVDGVAGIRWMLDVEVISSTMTPPQQGIFAQLVVFQEQADGTVLGFTDDGQFVQVGEAKTLDVVAIETDFGQPGAHPDFSALARPMSFGLQLGASYPRTVNPNAFFVDGRMTADNWRVEIAGGAGFFADGFESEVVVTQSGQVLTADDWDCNCPTPAVIQAQ